MLVQEFSDQFDILWNNVSSNQAPGLNEYEKSVFLTKAQSQLVKEYFNNRVDSIGGGFDGSQKRQYDFSGLIRTANLYNVNTYADRVSGLEKLDKRSYVFLMPWNYFLSVNEIISDNRWQYSVLPIDYAEYQRLMLKPYNYPVKRAAWRLNTDKKNCNFWEDFIETTDEYDDTIDSPINYRFISTWADEKRNLEINIKAKSISIYNTDVFPEGDMGAKILGLLPGGTTYIFHLKDGSMCNITVTTAEWVSSNMTRSIEIAVYATRALDDEEVIEALKNGCSEYRKSVDITSADNTFADMCRCTDGFTQATAPSEFSEFSKENDSVLVGKTFTTKAIQLPFVEVIGRFVGEPTYQMRYVRTLEPIILVNLKNDYGDGVSIEGVDQVTECKLPIECHEEILERAVTLAKIAWQGGTSTQAAAASRDRDRD